MKWRNTGTAVPTLSCRVSGANPLCRCPRMYPHPARMRCPSLTQSGTSGPMYSPNFETGQAFVGPQCDARDGIEASVVSRAA